MDAILNQGKNTITKTLVTDITALLVVGLLPAASHLYSIPVYYLEPMRVMLFVALLFCSRANAYALALTLPLFSFMVSGHPTMLKMLIITTELILNVWLFYSFYRKTHLAFVSTLGSILISKVACYAMYFIFFSMAFVQAEAQPTFLIIQGILALIISFSIWMVLDYKKIKSRSGAR